MLCWLLVISIIVGCHLSYAEHVVQNQGPCNFLDTVNITSGFIDQHGNYIHNGTVYTRGTFDEYNYVVENYTQMVMVAPHVRGCVCKFKPCIRVCCIEDENAKSECVKTKSISVPTKDGDDEEIDLSNSRYGVLIGKPCGKMYKLEPEQYEYDQWFFSNGTIQITDGDKEAGQRDYCFGQSKTKNESGDFMTQVMLCYYDDPDVRLTLYPIGMIFSLPFLLITFCVYGFIPELRNLHGKSLMCYVFGLTVLYTSLSIVQLENETFYPEQPACKISGFMIYISVLLCFFWLNVMCYDIWSTFRGGIRGRGGERKRFLFYCLYAFGVPIALTLGVYLIDNIAAIPDGFKPLIGIKRCWVQESRLVEALYIYTPISIILVINIILYSVTAYKIYRVQKETSVIRNGESQKHSKIDADKDRFFLYLRLFIVMGATWSMESISWVVGHPFIFYVSDILNCLQGFIIFILFVWKPKVKKLIIRSFNYRPWNDESS